MSQPDAVPVLRRPLLAMSVFLAFAMTLGTLGLLLGPATSDGFDTSFSDAMFTAASAATSTGLTVVDTAAHWSLLGKAIIAVLFEMSALALSFMAAAMLLVLFPRLGVRRRISTLGADGAVVDIDLKRLALIVAAVALSVQGLAAFALTLRFWIVGEFGFTFALRHGVFEAMSAFANAGFTLNSNSMMQFATDWWVSLVAIVAALAGTLGVPLLLDLIDNRRNTSAWSVPTRVGLAATAGMVVAVAGAFVVTEWSNPDTLGPFSSVNKFFVAFYQSVMARGTGFFSVAPTGFGEASSVVADFSMFVGGTVGSTGSGVTATALVALLSMSWADRRGGPADPLGQPFPNAVIRSAASAFMVGIATVLAATVLLLHLTEDLDVGRALFEVCSAFGGTGWTQGVTPNLDTAGRLVVIATMAIGRVVPLALLAALLHQGRSLHAAGQNGSATRKKDNA